MDQSAKAFRTIPDLVEHDGGGGVVVLIRAKEPTAVAANLCKGHCRVGIVPCAPSCLMGSFGMEMTPNHGCWEADRPCVVRRHSWSPFPGSSRLVEKPHPLIIDLVEVDPDHAAGPTHAVTQ
jgi:hypothetical protein